jgi:hypothetical protein
LLEGKRHDRRKKHKQSDEQPQPMYELLCDDPLLRLKDVANSLQTIVHDVP